MFRKRLKLKGILASMMLVIAMSSANSVFAFGSFGGDVDDICAAAGNSLLPEFGSQVFNNCTACHDDGDGGSGGGRSAYSQSDAAIIAFFCPPVEPPAPPVEPPAPPVEPPAPPVEPTQPPPLTCTDNDGDGFSAEGGDCGQMDCNDNEFTINPAAEESCSDGIDNNCNNLVDTADPNAMGCPAPTVCTDLDNDGFSIVGGSCGPMDCSDSDARVNPGASEICDDNIDNNCDGTIDAADAACQTMDEDEHRKDRHDRDRDEHDNDEHDVDDDEDKDENRKDRHDRDEDDDDDDHEAEDDDDDHEAGDRKDRRKNQRRNRWHHDD